MNWEKFKDFNPAEFECRCGCGLCTISEKLLITLQNARDISREITSEEYGHTKGIPFRIARGCSCIQHNSSLPHSSPTSSHIADDKKECTAVDIKVRTAEERFIILKSLFLAGFKRIGMYNSHNGIHADVDVTKVQNVCWKL